MDYAVNRNTPERNMSRIFTFVDLTLCAMHCASLLTLVQHLRYLEGYVGLCSNVKRLIDQY